MTDLAALIGQRFVERRDVKAVQHRDGSYAPERTPMKMGDLRSHLAGTRTLGHYLVSPEGTCRLFAYDIDLRKEGVWVDEAGEEQQIKPREVWLDPDHPARPDLALQLRCMAEGLALRVRRYMGVPVAVAYSGGKGLHVYAFLGSSPAADAKAAAVEVLKSWTVFHPVRGDNFWQHESAYRCLEIEVFPKQGSVADKEKNLGNLMRLPLGVNRKTGQEGYFLDLATGYDQIVPGDPVTILAKGAEW